MVSYDTRVHAAPRPAPLCGKVAGRGGASIDRELAETAAVAQGALPGPVAEPQDILAVSDSGHEGLGIADARLPVVSAPRSRSVAVIAVSTMAARAHDLLI